MAIKRYRIHLSNGDSIIYDFDGVSAETIAKQLSKSQPAWLLISVDRMPRIINCSHIINIEALYGQDHPEKTPVVRTRKPKGEKAVSA